MSNSKGVVAVVNGHKNIEAALAAFQADIPAIGKGNEASIKAKSGATFSYSFADLADITRVAMPLLAKQGLSFSACPTMLEGQFVLEYGLRHVSGDSIGGLYPLTLSGGPQDLGSAITYARRYAFNAVTGIAPGGEDDDGARAQAVAAHVKQAPVRRDPVPATTKIVFDGPSWAARIAKAGDVSVLRGLYSEAQTAGLLGEALPDKTLLGAAITAAAGALENSSVAAGGSDGA